MISSEDTTMVEELLLANVPFERIIEIFHDRIDEKKLTKIARKVFSQKTNTEDPDISSSSVLGDSGRLILNRSVLREEIPEDFIDPIFLTVIKDPVVISSGFVLDRHTVIDEETKELKFRNCPFTREKLEEKVYPLLSLKKKLFAFKKKKIEQLLELCENAVGNDNLERFMSGQALIKAFIDDLGSSTNVHFEKKVAELNFIAWEKAETSLKKELWDSDALADNLIRFYKGIPNLDVEDENLENERQKFHARIEELESYIYDAMSDNQWDLAKSWCDACDIFNKMSKIHFTIPGLSKIRLEIAKKLKKEAEANLFHWRLSHYIAIQSDLAAVEKFFEDEALSRDEINKLKWEKLVCFQKKMSLAAGIERGSGELNNQHTIS